jgi:hypothetical protein
VYANIALTVVLDDANVQNLAKLVSVEAQSPKVCKQDLGTTHDVGVVVF